MTALSCGPSAGTVVPADLARVPPRTRAALSPMIRPMNEATPSAPSDVATARAARQSLVVSKLAQILPANCILYRGEETAPYECDGLTAYRQLPLVVVIPE